MDKIWKQRPIASHTNVTSKAPAVGVTGRSGSTGQKRCGIGICGCCAVLVDGWLSTRAWLLLGKVGD